MMSLSMASITTACYRGIVKAVPSGDSIVIMPPNYLNNSEIPEERTITLSAVVAPKLAGRGNYTDEAFAWNSREYLRKLCIGKEVVYTVEYTEESLGLLLGSVFLDSINVAEFIVSQGWASVRRQPAQLYYPYFQYFQELINRGAQAYDYGLGRWSKVPGAEQASIRTLPNLDAPSVLAANKGKCMEAIVEEVRDGSTVRAYLLPDFHFVQVFIAGVQAPGMKRGSQPVAPFAPEAKFFTETRVLNRDVRIVLEGVDKYNKNLIGSVYYPDGDSEKDLGLELVENGYANYVEWSGKAIDEDASQRLKSAESEAKKNKLRIWENFVTNLKPIHDQNFTGKVVEVVSGDCVIVADDSVERRVNLSSVLCPKMGSLRRGEMPAPYAREAKEFLRTRLIGRQVNVQMEYSRKVPHANGTEDYKVMDFGSVFLVESEGEDANQQTVGNVGELVVECGLGRVIRHRDFEEKSRYYDALLSAESRAIAYKNGIHSSKDVPVIQITDLTMAPPKISLHLLPSLQRTSRISAIVEYVLSGHRLKVYIPKEKCSIAFSFTGVRCPGRDEPYSDEAIAVMRRRVMQRDVEIEVKTVDSNGTFFGTLWESGTNVSIALVEAGLGKYIPFGGSDKIQDAHLLATAEKSAKTKKLKIWENYIEGQEAVSKKQKEELKVVVTEVLDSGKFYVQTVGKIDSIQQQLDSLNLLEEAPGCFDPREGDIVLAHFAVDDSWNRAKIVKAVGDEFEVFYMDYGNQEVVPYSHLRPLGFSASTAPGLARLCSLAYIKVPSLEEVFGQEAGEYLSELTLDSSKEFKAVIEERDFSGGKVVTGQGTGPVLLVSLVPVDAEVSINADMVKNGLARLVKEKRFWKSSENLREFQDEARKFRRGMWQYGDYKYDDQKDRAPPARRTVGKR